MRRFIACFALLLASTARAQDTVVVVVRHIPSAQDTGVVVRHINTDSAATVPRAAPRRFAPPSGPPYGTRFPARPNEYVFAKDPNLASGLSLVFPGGGQYYAGASGKGALITLIAFGAPIIGYANVHYRDGGVQGITPEGPGCYHGGSVALGATCDRGTDWTPAAVGLAVGLGSWFYGIVSAKSDALKWNKDHHVQFIAGPGRAGFAVRVP